MMWQKLLVIAAAAVVVTCHHERSSPFRAVVRLSSPLGQDITGNITFTELPEGKTHVEGVIFGLPRGEYGFHVHEKGDITGGCLSTGAHFNPEHKDHGHPNDENRHVGDLGNVVFDDNKFSHLDFYDSKIDLSGPNCILGRAVVLHEKQDDFGRGGSPDSKKTGDAGGRVACGVIGILQPVYGWHSSAAAGSTVSVYIDSALILALLPFMMIKIASLQM